MPPNLMKHNLDNLYHQSALSAEATGETKLTTMRTFDNCALFQLRLGYSADAGRSLKVHIAGLNTSHTAQLLVTILLPLCYEVGVGISLF